MSKTTELIKDDWRARYNKYGYICTIGLKPNTRDELKKVGQTGVAYDKTIMRILQVLKMYPEIRKLVTEYDYKEEVN
jgi:hypothetical protein